MIGENKTQVIARMQFTLAEFTACPSAENYIKMQKAMIDYQEHRDRQRGEEERELYFRGKVNYDYYDTEDYLCTGYPGKKCEYRCTINGVYSNPGCAGHKILDNREGDYICAYSPQEALEIMRKTYPDWVDEGFTVEIWKVLD